MFFLGLIIIGALVATALDRLSLLSIPKWRDRLRVGLSIGLILVGIDHLVTIERYVPMIDAFLPYPRAIVAFTGLCEIAGAIGLMIPSLRRWAGIMLALYFISVFPANIANALQSVSIKGLPDSSPYYWFRLALQPIFIGLALYVSRSYVVPVFCSPVELCDHDSKTDQLHEGLERQ